MHKVLFYETGFDRTVPDLAFYGRAGIGDKGYTDCKAHMHRHMELQYLLSGSETFFIDEQSYTCKLPNLRVLTDLN